METNIFFTDDSPISHRQSLFNKILMMKHRMQSLASFVQNDFESMVGEGMITEADIAEAINDLDATYNAVIDELNALREESRSIMLKYINSNNKTLN